MNVDRLGCDGLRTFGNTAIAIRTAKLEDGRLHVQAGGVADSNPQSEWNETMAVNPWARAVMRAAAEASGASS